MPVEDFRNPSRPAAFMNWSGGKDSALALYRLLKSDTVRVPALLTSMNAAHNRISMHGVRRALLEAQATALQIPLHTIELPEEPDMKEYEGSMMDKVSYLKNSGCEQAVFGDIFLEDLKKYREEKLNQVGVSCLFPLWKEDTRSLAEEFISLGFKSILVCVSEKFLDKSFCGRVIDRDFLNDLPAGIDPCGENGEFHSFVFDGPLFPGPIRFQKGETVYRTYKAPGQHESSCGFYFCDLVPF